MNLEDNHQRAPVVDPPSENDIALYDRELIMSHPASMCYINIVLFWRMELFCLLELEEDKLRLAFCIVNGILSCWEDAPARFLSWDPTVHTWTQLDVFDAAIFTLKALQAGFGEFRQLQLPFSNDNMTADAERRPEEPLEMTYGLETNGIDSDEIDALLEDILEPGDKIEV